MKPDVWLKLSDRFARQLLQLCREHPKLAQKLMEECAKYEPDPAEPWQDRSAAVQYARSRWSREEDEIEVDDDAAISVARDGTDSGIWVQAWLWVSQQDLESALTAEVHES
jgi:hypothetical protein